MRPDLRIPIGLMFLLFGNQSPQRFKTELSSKAAILSAVLGNQCQSCLGSGPCCFWGVDARACQESEQIDGGLVRFYLEY